uniref:Uncharacterized protein n=1 Tax=uncultured Thiotrichaceae bacterium TaxID=298394 RepID=A0A6S6UFD9_9GAMM|nr:MAG: Unknown protein [uncultured Thiotrichaceae bacterium]
MNLSDEDAGLFYQLMQSLQCYINQKTKLLNGVKTPDDIDKLSQEDKITLRNSVYEHPELLTSFVNENPYTLPSESLDIVKGWTNYASGDFFMERYLKNYAIFIGNNNVYAVNALYDSFDLMIPKAYLPRAVSTVLLPFKGRIVFDGLMFSSNIHFGGNMKASLKEDYMRAKQNGRIIDTLPPSDKLTTKPSLESASKSKDWSREIKQLQKTVKPLKGGSGQPPLNSPAFSLLKNSIDLASQAAVESADFDTLCATLKKVRRSLSQVENIVYRMEDY